ncbi:AMP-binding protein [Paraburkholderia caribensis]|uniref:AMP-binding protein n=1 Tax=Paraburkholderia caribensis TaxID=75105 RepID=UPI0034D25280
MTASSDTTDRLYIDALLEQLNARSDEAVIRYLSASVTGGALRSSIFRYARALETLGIGRGSVVALQAPNCPDALSIRYAGNLLGATTLYLPALDARRQAVLLARIEPAMLVVFAQTAHLVPDGVRARIVSVGFGPETLRLDKHAAALSDEPMPTRAMPDDPGVLVSSGGTAGVPKCSLRSFAAYSTMVGSEKMAGRRQLINGALAYLSQVLVDKTLIGGGTVVLERQYDAAQTLASIEAERITDVLLIEPQLFETMDHPDLNERDLSSLRCIAHVGGSVPATLRQRALKRFGPVLAQMYGASEAGLIAVLAGPHYATKAKLQTFAGHILDGVAVRIRRDDGRLADVGQVGGIEVNSRSAAQEYCGQPLEAARKFRDGWCLTGDAGFIDDNGYLRVLGRASDVFKIGGVATGPTDIEEVLCRLPDVRFAAAFAAADKAGYMWNVAVEPWAGKQVTLARCATALELTLGTVVADSARFVVVDRVPRTEQGKVDRGAVEGAIAGACVPAGAAAISG